MHTFCAQLAQTAPSHTITVPMVGSHARWEALASCALEDLDQDQTGNGTSISLANTMFQPRDKPEGTNSQHLQ